MKLNDLFLTEADHDTDDDYDDYDDYDDLADNAERDNGEAFQDKLDMYRNEY